MSSTIPHSSSMVGKHEAAALEEVIASNYVGDGPSNIKLAAMLCNYIGQANAVVVNNGSSALFLALQALKAKYPSKDQVIVSSYVCPAIINTILGSNLKLSLVDVNSEDLNMDLSDVEQKINESTLVVIAASIGGIPMDIGAVKALGLPVIDDCSQAIGSEFNNRRCGTDGDISIFSFGSTKMVTGGTGGAALTNDEDLYQSMKELATYEKPVEYYRKHGFELSYNVGLSNLNASIIISQIERIAGFIDKRRDIAAQYDAAFTSKDVSLQVEGTGELYNRYRYYILAEDRERILNEFLSNDIVASPSLAHNIASYFNLEANQFPNLWRLQSLLVSIPIYPGLSESEIGKIVDTIEHV